MRNSTLLGLSVLFLLSPPSWGQATSSVEDDPRTLAIRLEGSITGEKTLTLDVEPGPVATKAIRVYSEPSHTLLALVLDSTFEASEEGKSWQATALAGEIPQATAYTRLPEGRARLHMPLRPESDDRIAVWINGDWPDGTTEDRLISDGKVGSDGFSFSTSVR